MKFAAIIALASLALFPAFASAQGPRDGRGAQVQSGAGAHGPKKHHRKHHHKKHHHKHANGGAKGGARGGKS